MPTTEAGTSGLGQSDIAMCETGFWVDIPAIRPSPFFPTNLSSFLKPKINKMPIVSIPEESYIWIVNYQIVRFARAYESRNNMDRNNFLKFHT